MNYWCEKSKCVHVFPSLPNSVLNSNTRLDSPLQRLCVFQVHFWLWPLSQKSRSSNSFLGGTIGIQPVCVSDTHSQVWVVVTGGNTHISCICLTVVHNEFWVSERTETPAFWDSWWKVLGKPQENNNKGKTEVHPGMVLWLLNKLKRTSGLGRRLIWSQQPLLKGLCVNAAVHIHMNESMNWHYQPHDGAILAIKYERKGFKFRTFGLHILKHHQHHGCHDVSFWSQTL